MGYEVPHLHSWLKEKAAETTRAPSNEGARVINLISKSGAEGQSRTDTGSPHRFLSLVRVVLISVIRRVLVQPPEDFPPSVRA